MQNCVSWGTTTVKACSLLVKNFPGSDIYAKSYTTRGHKKFILKTEVGGLTRYFISNKLKLVDDVVLKDNPAAVFVNITN